MCTLIALHRCIAGAPLVVAANRDEYLDRPAEGPAVRRGPGGPVAAPLDRRAGGTWYGVNARGTFAGLTNRPASRPDPSRRSRGLLVLDALARGKAAEAVDDLSALPRGAYNPFNLLVADAEDAYVVVYEDAPRVEALEPGVHVIGNVDPDDRSVPKVARLLDRAAAAARRPGAGLLDDLAAICRAHDGREGPLSDTCIHLGDPLAAGGEAGRGGYGTRSSTLLRLGEPGTPGEWRFADGPPCRTPYQDVSHLLHELGLGHGS